MNFETFISSLSEQSRVFENFAAKLISSEYNTEDVVITPRSNDGGRDGEFLNGTGAFECKCHNSSVSSHMLLSFLNTKYVYDYDTLVFFGLSFERSCFKIAEEHDIRLIDLEEMKELSIRHQIGFDGHDFNVNFFKQLGVKMAKQDTNKFIQDLAIKMIRNSADKELKVGVLAEIVSDHFNVSGHTARCYIDKCVTESEEISTNGKNSSAKRIISIKNRRRPSVSESVSKASKRGHDQVLMQISLTPEELVQLGRHFPKAKITQVYENN